jgi:hypothetical protein
MIHAQRMGMYLRITERRNRDGSTVAYYALAENIWNPEARRSETRVVHSFGRADQLDKAALQRLVASIGLRDWVSRPSCPRERAEPHPPCPTIRSCLLVFERSAARKWARHSMVDASVPTEA